jgi:hypothetical protein
LPREFARLRGGPLAPGQFRARPGGGDQRVIAEILLRGHFRREVKFMFRLTIRFHRATHGFDKNESAAVVADEGDYLKVQRADGTESVFPLDAGTAGFDVGEKRKLKVAAGDKLLLQSN